MKKNRWYYFVLVFILILIGSFVVWGLTPQSAMPTALEAMKSGMGNSECGCVAFGSQNSDLTAGFIFYPGGHVDYRAYAPLLKSLAEHGYLAVVVPMPLSLAVLDLNAAERVVNAFPDIQHWVIGGHSLGGSMAAAYAYSNPDAVEGLVLLGSYPASSNDLSSNQLHVVSISAEFDGLTSREDIDASIPLLPADTRFVEIAGGNHSQFGWYGNQSGDGLATILREDQQRIVVEEIINLLEKTSQ